MYAKATDYAAWVSDKMSAPRNESEKVLVGSFCHSAFDIALNIAEGSCRSKNQFDHYLKIAKTAIRECVVYTELAHNVELLGEIDYDQSREYLMELTRMIGALIISLQRSTERKQEEAGETQYSSSEEMSY